MKHHAHNERKFWSIGSRNKAGKFSATNVPMMVALSMLIFAGAVLFFNSNRPHNSAIEEAALAAARSMSQIVVNTPECGFISLSDIPADGKGTESADKFALPVRGINSIIGTARLDLIIADKLGQSLMEEFAEKDLNDALTAKDQLVTVLKKSLEPGAVSTNKDGENILVYDSALNSFKNILRRTGSSELTNVSLKMSLGCLDGGASTTVPVPEPQQSASLDSAMSDGKVYKSYVNVPYKGIDFVFGGIGEKVLLVDQGKWCEKIDSLPYQIPTIVKVEAISKKSKSGDSGQVIAVACAQPASLLVPGIEPGALTISFPDGPVPEIKHPEDCYLNEKLNSLEGDSMDLLTAAEGDYPTDSGSVMKSMNWPLTNSESAESTANVWRQALHDWIRTAGPKANIDSVVNMQKVVFDAPKPAKILWKAPISTGGGYTTIAPISAGIIHIFEFDRDGVVVYRSKLLAPYPLDAISQHQMYGETFGALDYSDIGIQEVAIPTSLEPKKIILMAAWDVFIRDHVRIHGTIHGGKHGGEPIAKPILASTNNPEPITSFVLEDQLIISRVSDNFEQDDFGKGRRKPFGKARIGVMGVPDSGHPPLITPQSDFSETMIPNPPFVRPMPFGSGVRPFLETSGSAVDIRFRREVDVTEFTGSTTTGFLGITGADE